MGVAFFDMDRTLIDVNSGHLWVREEWRAGRMSTLQVGTALWWFARYAMGADDLEHAMQVAAAKYGGVAEAEMQAMVGAWFDRDVRDHIRPGALRALKSHREAGDACVVATSSSQFAARCAQSAWNLTDIICTKVEVVDGVITGNLERNGFGHHKLEQCKQWASEHSIPLSDATFYTDSYSDLPLLEAVGTPVVVDPDRRLARAARERGWEIVDWGTAAA